ncbi:MAG TPA: Pycsar system effector family protein [Flavobacterium sp.]|nr:Pycsar system effector family protein [Flavobacterium sp.]
MTIIQKAEEFVFALFKDKLSPEYTYHNFNHTLRVVKAVEKIASNEKVTDEENTALLLAAWFHDTGYVSGHENHEQKSIGLFNEFAKNQNIDDGIKALTESLILVTDMQRVPATKPEFIIRDADCSHFGKKNFLETSELLREEWKLTQNKNYSDIDWAIGNRNMLNQMHRFFTDYTKNKWQAQKEENIAVIQEKIQQLESNKKESITENVDRKKKEDRKDKPERGIETMFRVTLNNHTQLSQIADSKANILLSVNAIIISISLSTLIPKLDSPGNAHLVIPTFILILFSVISIVFAILSTKPKVTGGLFTRKDIADKNVNLLFFGNFWKMPLEEYQWAMNEMMKDKQYLYDSMIKDLYFLGLVLHRKYKLLRITYTIFMIGIIVSVLAFVIAFRTIRG